MIKQQTLFFAACDNCERDFSVGASSVEELIENLKENDWVHYDKGNSGLAKVFCDICWDSIKGKI